MIKDIEHVRIDQRFNKNALVQSILDRDKDGWSVLSIMPDGSIYYEIVYVKYETRPSVPSALGYEDFEREPLSRPDTTPLLTEVH